MKDATHAPALCARFHHASELIGRRWTGAIIFVLLQKTCRFAALRAAIPDITDRMLSERLQELEEEGLVERTVVPDTPVRVEYSLTKKGKALAGAIGSIATGPRNTSRRSSRPASRRANRLAGRKAAVR